MDISEANEHSFRQPAVHISFEERIEEPNWELIEEISLPLLERGIGSFDVLQQSLRSVALCRINEKDEEDFSRPRLVKLLRLAQFQIEYLLKSQAVILERLEASWKECEIAKETAVALKKQMKAARYLCENVIAAASANNPVFECATCGKIFLSGDFLMSHIDRHHRSVADRHEHISDEENSDHAEGSDRPSKVLLAISDLRQELLHRDHTKIAVPTATKHSPSLLTLNSAVAERLERLEFATDRILTEVMSAKPPPSSAVAPTELAHRIIPSPSPVPPETESGSMLLTAERFADQKLPESQTHIYESISPEIGGQLNQSIGSADTSVWGSSMESMHGWRRKKNITAAYLSLRIASFIHLDLIDDCNLHWTVISGIRRFTPQSSLTSPIYAALFNSTGTVEEVRWAANERLACALNLQSTLVDLLHSCSNVARCLCSAAFHRLLGGHSHRNFCSGQRGCDSSSEPDKK